MDKEFLKRKLTLANRYFEELSKVEFDLYQMENEIDIYAKVLFLYQNVIERCLGLATYIIKDQKLPIPSTAKQAFMELSRAKILDTKTAKRLGGAYGFRNAIIHDYDQIKLAELVEEHSNNLDNLKTFLKAIAKYIENKKSD